jgi:hypothetical protein
MAEKNESGALGHGRAKSVDDCLRVLGENRQGQRPQRQTLALGGSFPAPVHGAVLVIGEQDFSRVAQGQSVGDQIDCR